MRLVIATHNAKKAQEMVTILSAGLPGWEILTLADFPNAPEPEETAGTYRENAAIKAESASLHTGELCLADDAGLEIDSLPGELGVFSKRFGGEDTGFEEKMGMVLYRMADVPQEARGARFVCHVALSRADRPTLDFSATCEGSIARAASGKGGFGYDPIFFLPDLGRTMAELSPAEKHAVSHRGKVLKELLEHLCQFR